MKDKYFRIVELPEHDVLIEKDWDEETDSPLCCITFHIEGVRLKQKLGYKTEEQRDKAFDDATNEKVQELVTATLKLIESE